MAFVEVKKVTQKYGDTLALNNISFSLERGEILSILGPNGAGKTTLIKIITGYLLPTSGSVIIDDDSKVGVVFGGDLGFYNNVSAYDNLVFFARLKKIPRKNIDQQVKAALAEVALIDAMNNQVSTYSKGMKQRLHIARALLDKPSFLLLDEPTNGLDIEVANDIRKLILKLQAAGTTIILTTHVLTDIESLSNRILLIGGGQIKYDCDLQSLIELADSKSQTRVETVEQAYLTIVDELRR